MAQYHRNDKTDAVVEIRPHDTTDTTEGRESERNKITKEDST